MAYSLPLSVLDIHTLIEQDTQSLGFYVYDSLETEEIDLQINKQIYLLIDGIIDKYFGRKLKVSPEVGFQVDQVGLDNLRKQHVKDASTTLSTFNQGKKFTINADYYHYIKGVASIAYQCYEKGVEVTKTISSKLRIVKTEHIDEMLSSPIHKTTKESPLAEIVGNYLYIYKDDTFEINSVVFDYIRKPIKVLYAKDIDGNYDSGNSVTTDLDDSLQYMLIDMVVLRLMKIKEQPQQKIVNLEQDTI
jgi:hypothetical protein